MLRIMRSDTKIEIYCRYHLTVVMQTFLYEHLCIFKVNDLGNLFSQQLQLFKISGETNSLPRAGYEIFEIIVNSVRDIFLVSLLLTLNRFQTFFRCFHCWHWTSKCRMVVIPLWALWCGPAKMKTSNDFYGLILRCRQ